MQEQFTVPFFLFVTEFSKSIDGRKQRTKKTSHTWDQLHSTPGSLDPRLNIDCEDLTKREKQRNMVPSLSWLSGEFRPLHRVIKEMPLPTATSCHILLLTVVLGFSQYLSCRPGWPTYHITLLNLTIEFGKTSNILLIDLFVSASRIQCLPLYSPWLLFISCC